MSVEVGNCFSAQELLEEMWFGEYKVRSTHNKGFDILRILEGIFPTDYVSFLHR
jgi:hypothetical protein